MALLAGCGSVATADSPAGNCLARHDYVLVSDGDPSTWKGPEGQFVNLARFHGTVQPVGGDDLAAFQSAGCG